MVHAEAVPSEEFAERLLIEEKVSLEEYIEEGFGTCDSNIIADVVLEIVDLKYGKGVRVDAVLLNAPASGAEAQLGITGIREVQAA